MLETLIAARFESLKVTFDEKSRRLWAAAEALSAGAHGVMEVNRATGISFNTIKRGIEELGEPERLKNSAGRTRNPGGGRKKTADTHPEIRPALEALVEPGTRGDPESALRWSCKSLRTLAVELSIQGFKVSHRMVGELLREMGYSLQSNRKSSEGKQHPDRNEQFEFINLLAEETLGSGNRSYLGGCQEERTGRQLQECRAAVASQGESPGREGLRFSKPGRRARHTLRSLRHRQKRGLGECRYR